MTQQQKQDDKMVVCSGCVRQTANLKGWMDDNAIVLDILPPPPVSGAGIFLADIISMF